MHGIRRLKLKLPSPSTVDQVPQRASPWRAREADQNKKNETKQGINSNHPTHCAFYVSFLSFVG